MRKLGSRKSIESLHALDKSSHSLSRSASSSKQWLNSIVAPRTAAGNTKTKLKDKEHDLGTPSSRDVSPFQLPSVSLSRRPSLKAGGGGSSRAVSVTESVREPKATLKTQKVTRLESDSECDIRFSDLSDDDIRTSSKPAKHTPPVPHRILNPSQQERPKSPNPNLHSSFEKKEKPVSLHQEIIHQRASSAKERLKRTESPMSSLHGSIDGLSPRNRDHSATPPPPSEPISAFGTSVSVQRTEHKVDEIKSIIEQQESRLRSQILQHAGTERTLLQSLAVEKEELVEELKEGRDAFHRVLVEAVKELKGAQEEQRVLQRQFLKEQRVLGEKQVPVVQVRREACEQCPAHRKEIEALRLEIDQYAQEVANLNNKVEAETETNNHLSSHISELQSLTTLQTETLQHLTLASTDLESHVQTMSQDRKHLRANHKKLSHEIESLREEVVHLEGVLEKKKVWGLENKSFLEDYRSAVAAAGLMELFGKEGKRKEGGYASLEDFVISTSKELQDVKRQLHRSLTALSNHESQTQTIKAELEKRNHLLLANQSNLETTVAIAEGLRGERDYAISKIKETIKACKLREAYFDRELEEREKGVLEVVETSNMNLKTVREGYEVERQKFKEEIRDLMKENMTLDANLRAVSKDRKEIESELTVVKKKLEFKNSDFLRELGIS
ncbi:hypothetical protein HDU98_004717, partial [Podochytrium sp. JEL0797]